MKQIYTAVKITCNACNHGDNLLLHRLFWHAVWLMIITPLISPVGIPMQFGFGSGIGGPSVATFLSEPSCSAHIIQSSSKIGSVVSSTRPTLTMSETAGKPITCKAMVSALIAVTSVFYSVVFISSP